MFLLDRLNKDHIISPLGITSAIAIVFVTYRAVSNAKDRKRFKNIPVPSPDYPIIGMLAQNSMPGKKVYQWHEELNSPIIRLKMGMQNWIMISDPVLCHEVLGKNGKSTAGRPYGTYGYEIYGRGGKGLSFVGQSKQWKSSRAALLEILSPKNVTKYNDFIELEACKLVERLMHESEKSNGVDPHKLLALNALNVICHVSFGKNYESVDDPEYNKILYMIEQGLHYAGSSSDIPKFFPFLSFLHKYLGVEKKMTDFIKNIRDPLMEKLIKEARFNNDAPNIIRSIEEDYSFLDHDQKTVMLNDVLNAGTDPLQHIFRWIFALLCHYPEIQRELAAEIDSFEREHGRLPTFYDKDKMPFANSTISECLRVRSPTTFGLPHLVTEDVSAGEYFIPEGSIVMSSYDHMQMSPHFINNGHEIDFRRYMNQEKSLLFRTRGKFENRDLYTFGWGRRTCPGIHLANVQLFSIFITIFSRCTIEPTVGDNGDLVYPDHKTGRCVGISTEILPYKVRFVPRPN
ncbi:cytochrome P450 [Backusella circina FSU 941]|nr:cytochrome P450 [Backusella circina FSU 941]